MKKMLKSRLYALAMGVTFCASSNAARYSVLNMTTLLVDQNEVLPVGLPSVSPYPFYLIKSVSTINWQGSPLDLYFFKDSIPAIQSMVDINQPTIPVELRTQIVSIMSQNGPPLNDIDKKFSRIVEKNTAISSISLMSQQIGVANQDLESLLNSNQKFKILIKELIEDGDFYNEKLGQDTIKTVPVPNSNDFSIDLVVPNQPENMNDDDWIQVLQDLKLERINFREAFNRALPMINAPLPPQ